jgi:hypothetical protein
MIELRQNQCERGFSWYLNRNKHLIARDLLVVIYNFLAFITQNIIFGKRWFSDVSDDFGLSYKKTIAYKGGK